MINRFVWPVHVKALLQILQWKLIDEIALSKQDILNKITNLYTKILLSWEKGVTQMNS